MNVLSSPSLILMRRRSVPSLASRTLPVPLFGSYSHAPDHVTEAPVFVGFTFTYARRQCIRSRSPWPVIEISAGPRSSRCSFTPLRGVDDAPPAVEIRVEAFVGDPGG